VSDLENPKTDAQRNAVHLWIRLVAQLLNDSGIDKRVVIHKMATRGLDTQWTPESFKADVYKPIFQAVAAKQSTEQASTTDHDIVIQGISKWLAQEFGIVCPPFPDRYSQSEGA